MRIAKFPYFFYFMQNVNSEDLEIKDDYINIKDKKYSITKTNKYIYLFLRYFPIFILLGTVFNSYDFSFENSKILQYIMAIFLFLILVSFKKNGFVVVVSILLIVGIVSILNISSIEDLTMQFVSKYLILLYFLYDLFKNFKVTVYAIKENHKIKSHLIFKGENEWKK